MTPRSSGGLRGLASRAHTSFSFSSAASMGSTALSIFFPSKVLLPVGLNGGSTVEPLYPVILLPGGRRGEGERREGGEGRGRVRVSEWQWQHR